MRSSVRAHRKIHEIAPEEIANAIRLTLSQAGPGCTETELVRGVIELFGFSRMGHLIKAGVTGVLDQLGRSGEIRQEGGHLVLGESSSPRDAAAARWFGGGGELSRREGRAVVLRR